MAASYMLQKLPNGMHCIEPDPAIVQKLTQNNNKRIVCRLNDAVEIHGAIMSPKEGAPYVMIGAATCKKLGIQKGQLVTATFRIDESEYQFDMPEELSEVLATDPEASELFHGLTKGNQRGLIYLVTRVKSIDKRIERALTIAERIKAGHSSPRTILKK